MPYNVVIKGLATISIKNDNLQPFCAIELRNKVIVPSMFETTMTPEGNGDAIIGCDSGTMIVVDVKNTPKSLIVIGKIHIHDSKPRFPETLIEKRSFCLPDRDEPITHIIEVQGKSPYDNCIIACTLNGWLYLINHVTKKIIRKLFL
jgi:hypothetical protein